MEIQNTIDQFLKDMIHQQRTFLVTIKTGIVGVKNYLPQLLQAYHIAKKYDQSFDTIPARHLALLIKCLDNCETEAHSMNDYLNTLEKQLRR